jgi:hypothetical protein
MADFYTQFLSILDVGTAEYAARAEMIRREFATELDRHEGESLGFNMGVDHESGPGALWIHSDEYGNPEHVIGFVLRCAGEFGLAGLWGFTWSYTCSKPRIGAFGGGAHVLDLRTGETVSSVDCTEFVNEHIARGDGHLEAAAPPMNGGGNGP